MVCLIFNLMFNPPGKPGINVRDMNHYAKIAAAVAGGIFVYKVGETGVKTIARVISKAAAKVAGMNNNEAEAPAEEQPKPETKKPDKKGSDKKDDNKTPGKGEEKPEK